MKTEDTFEDQVDSIVAEHTKKLQEKTEALRNQMYRIDVEVLEGGKLPMKAHSTDAGFDLYATDDITLLPGQVMKHPLNIRMKLPAGSWGRIETKSGLGSQGMLVYAGVVDEEYRGIPHVIMTNLNPPVKIDVETKIVHTDTGPVEQVTTSVVPNMDATIVVKKGMKLAQMTMNPHSNAFFIRQVESVDTNTSRGEGGFGSTGVK